ncbi:MAG: O-methyltransferase [Eubacterium sp.]|nr:O-methyltransferase [Eubacterium sp.]
MILDERLLTYLNSLDRGNSELLNQIEMEALADEVPIIRKDMQVFLKFLLAVKKPQRILEVGCAIGFSALLMAENNPVEATITTIENWPPRIPVARENFRRAGREQQITLIEGDAGEVLPQLLAQGERYDWIFMDAAKGQYPLLLPTAVELLVDDGLLLSDNVLFDGDIIESRFAVTRRNRTIHKRMRDYLYTLTHHEQLVTTVLPVGDGAAVSVKLGNS